MSMLWVGIGSAVLGAGASIYSADHQPGAPAPRNLGNELGSVGSQYPNILNTLLGGSGGFTQNYLGNLGTLTGGAFDVNKWFADNPGKLEEYNAAKASGELSAGWTPEMYAKQFMGGDTPSAQDQAKYDSYRSGGLPSLDTGLNTATRTSNLADAFNLGPAYTALTRGLNTDYYGALDKYSQDAFQQVQQSGPQQQAAQRASQGFGTFDPSGLYANTNFSSQTVNPMMVGAQQVQAPTGMLNVQAQGVRAASGNPLLTQLNQQAMANQGPSQLQQGQNAIGLQALQNGGNLSASDLRNVQQASRTGFAARGLDATNASIVDEAMQTDAASRARLQQNLGIAQSVQNQGLAEQNQQQQFGLGIGNQNFGYGQLNLQGQQANQNAGLQAQLANQGAFQNLNALNLQGQLANQSAGLEAGRANQGTSLAAQQSNQGSNLQAQGLGLQAQQSNQNFGLGSFNANLNSQQMQQQALMQSAALQEQQRQAQLQQQAQAVQLQRQGFLDPFAAITGSADQNLFGQILGANQANQSTQAGLYGSLLGYGQDLNNTNYNANAAANIAGYNGQQSLYGSLISAGSSLGGAYLGSQGGSGGAGNGVGGTTSYNLGSTICWIARAVFGEENPKWLLFRHWLLFFAPLWFVDFYIAHGEKIAAWLNRHPAFKRPIRWWMESRIATLNLD